MKRKVILTSRDAGSYLMRNSYRKYPALPLQETHMHMLIWRARQKMIPCTGSDVWYTTRWQGSKSCTGHWFIPIFIPLLQETMAATYCLPFSSSCGYISNEWSSQNLSRTCLDHISEFYFTVKKRSLFLYYSKENLKLCQKWYAKYMWVVLAKWVWSWADLVKIEVVKKMSLISPRLAIPVLSNSN